MRTKLMIATAAAAALLAGAAYAQVSGSNFSQSSGDTAVNPPANSSALPSGVATGNAAEGPAPATGQDVTAPAARSDTTVAPAAGPATERAPASSVGGNDVVSNGPVPDTPENRAKYGKPMSNAGRRTQPAGN